VVFRTPAARVRLPSKGDAQGGPSLLSASGSGGYAQRFGLPRVWVRRTGEPGTAEVILHALLDARRNRYVSALGIATVYAGLGKKEQTLQWLDTAFQERSGALNGVRTMLPFDGVQSDPRFIRLLKRMGLEE